MPRVSSISEEAPKRVVRKRAPRRTAAAKASATVRDVPASVPRQDTDRVRKAPTLIPKSRSEKSYKKLGVLAGFILVTFSVAAGIGFSDSGKLDVTELVNERNKDQADQINQEQNNSGSESVVVPVQNTNPVPVSSMRGRGVGSQNAAPVSDSAATGSTATTTDAVESTEVEGETEDSSALEAESSSDETVSEEGEQITEETQAE